MALHRSDHLLVVAKIGSKEISADEKEEDFVGLDMIVDLNAKS
jgi:hypothetical protein